MNKKSLRQHPCRRAFTLIELLVVLVIIGILSTLGFAVMGRVRTSADSVATVNSLKQLGAAMQLSVNDHDGKLPGPFWSGNFAWYTNTDTQTFGYQLWNYLNCPAPTSWQQYAAIIDNPANTRLRQDGSSPVYLLTDTIASPGQTTISHPWGYLSTNSPSVKLVNLVGYNLSTQMAAEDIDQGCVTPSFSRYAQLPKAPVLGNVRMTLYFDWHVAPVPVK